MPNENYEMSKTRFGEEMQKRMDALGLSIRDVSDKLGSTYEYVRRMVRGMSLPSKYMIVNLEEILQWHRDEMRPLMVSDKIERQHGGIPAELAGKNPELAPFEHGWPMLSEHEKEILLNQLNSFVRQYKKHARNPTLNEVRAEISRLKRIEASLAGDAEVITDARTFTAPSYPPPKTLPSHPPSRNTGRVMSPEDSQRRSDAQKARWARVQAQKAEMQPS